MDAVYIITSLLLVLLLIVVRSIKITSSAMSVFELRRRATQHEVEAVLAQQREAKLPDVLALRYLLEITLTVLLITALILAYGPTTGALTGLILLLVIPKISSIPTIGRIGQNKYDTREEQIIEFAHKRRGLLRYFRQPSAEVKPYPLYSKEELVHVAEQAKGVITHDEVLLLRHGLDFANKTVADVMTKKSDIVYVEQDDVLGPVVLDRLHKAGHSTFPVIKKDVDHIVGMLDMRDIGALPRQVTTVKRYMQPDVFYIRQDHTLQQALHGFLHTGSYLFIVINELRETVGVVSLQDVISALFGRKLSEPFSSYEDIREVADYKKPD